MSVKYTIGHDDEPLTLKEIYDKLDELERRGIDLRTAEYQIKTKGLMSMKIKELEVVDAE
jgi:hypothetical protein